MSKLNKAQKKNWSEAKKRNKPVKEDHSCCGDNKKK